MEMLITLQCTFLQLLGIFYVNYTPLRLFATFGNTLSSGIPATLAIFDLLLNDFDAKKLKKLMLCSEK